MANDADVLVVGEALIDEVHAIDDSVERLVGGSPANVAGGLSRLGARAQLLTCIADDADGAVIRASLAATGVIVAAESETARRTPVARVTMTKAGQPEYRFDVEWRIPASFTLAQSVRHVHVGSYAAFMEPGAERVLALAQSARSRGVTVSFDPNIRSTLTRDPADTRERFERLCHSCRLVKLSDEDQEWLYPGSSTSEIIDRVLQLGPECVVITMGAHGSVMANAMTSAHISSERAEVIDTVGAGDSFMAALIDSSLTIDLGSADSSALHAVGEFCARAAAITVSRRGADLPTRDDIAALAD